ncbi:MAG: hypothetical protein ACXV2J_15270 [Actinomycetes bacterium]
MSRRTLLALALAVVALAAGLVSPRAGAPLAATGAAAAETKPLTNLAHLDWLGATVQPPHVAHHTTYRLAQQPSIGVLWTYAEPGPDGALRRVGGGKYDATTNTYGQGAYNADDISRAAVVYLRHWRLTGSTASRTKAYELLRGLTYLQTATGPNAGNVVLWMQPDGTLHPSADPVEQPDPSDSDAAYWVARTVWALGEGYAAFRKDDPAFAGFLRERLDLSIAALNREVLDAYGTFQSIDGERTPRWLIADGGDATSEAMLGLAAYVDAGGGAQARTALRQFAEGVAMLGGGDQQTWPFGAVRPWALSRSVWHAWGAQMPAGLARAGAALGNKDFVAPAVTDSAVFTPLLLTSGGPDNGRLPTRIDQSQIAYGADARVESLMATADAAHLPGLRTLAGVAAAWFFGANPAGVPAYDPATGRTIDGINNDGSVNKNSGAESTIHGLLAMLQLDAHPAVAAVARTAAISERVGTRTLQAEDATLAGGATVVKPASLWTGESQYGGSGYVSLPNGGTAQFTVPAGVGPAVVLPVVDLQPGSSAVTAFTGPAALGSVQSGAIGAQGSSPAPGALLPVTLPTTLSDGATTVTATTTAGGADDARLDALLLEPLVSRYVLGDAAGNHGTALLHSAATTATSVAVTVPGQGAATAEVYDRSGALASRTTVGSAMPLTVSVLPGGFTLVRR